MEYNFFGGNFTVYDIVNSSSYKLESQHMIDALNYIKSFLKKNIMPSEPQIMHFITHNGGEIIIDIMDELCNYINENDYFMNNKFKGFISLDEYNECNECKLIEKYVNEEDNITIFVYEYAQNINYSSIIKDRKRIYAF